jgi:hypothetical protein
MKFLLTCGAKPLKKKEAYNGETTTTAAAAAVRHADGPKK